MSDNALMSPKPPQVLDEDDFDTLTVIDMGDAISLGQVTEDDDLHDVIIGKEQAKRLIDLLKEFADEQ
ncbi:hypothetical protein BSL82_03795 [Tardibacter chloracetimidivorans]|uniref:Uncharacterized protein n=1 Tax=Tardibacter chloracetimidivorans TaxID=1921510 RepID=A0A1L3ZSF5_9SPHN|nr:hypothetical protein [Tardibacter chloracetimidivorans]API58540.1 hypothetical protein BSL82_03795 [Tardibacter chloracetimidivorans]